MKEFKTGRGTVVDKSDVLSFEPTPSRNTWLVKLVPYSVVTEEVMDSCGLCEECYSNGMPQFCQSPTRTKAFFYKTPSADIRLWGNLEEGFYLNSCYGAQ